MISRAILVDAEPRLAAAIRFVMEREGTEVAVVEAEELDSEGADVVIVGLSCEDELERRLDAINGTPTVCLSKAKGRGPAVKRHVLESNAEYARDVVTLARLVAAASESQRQANYVGQLSDHFSAIALVRAIASLKESMVLSLARGLRRGEIRFYHGEVTSAQVGMLHGISALHQLLLWTEARFELRREPIVRRQQIPLRPSELWRDAVSFLESLRDVAPSLSPALTYVSNTTKVITDDIELPDQVQTVLRLFDGMRVLADVIEDSPFGVLATLKIASRLQRVGLISFAKGPDRSSVPVRTEVEEWLFGTSVADVEVVEGEAGAWTQFEVKETDGEAYSPVVPSAGAVGVIEAAPVRDSDEGRGARLGSGDTPAAVRDALSGEITLPHGSQSDTGIVPLPSVVVDGIEVISDDAREAAGLASVVANIPDGADEFEEVTKPGKRLPGYYGVPAAEAEAVPPLTDSADWEEKDEGDLAASALGAQVAKMVEDASQVAGLAGLPREEAEFYRMGSKRWRENEDFELDEGYEVSSSFWDEFWSAPNRPRASKTRK